jgi:hypothetical protein
MGRSATEPTVNAVEHALDLFKYFDPTCAVRSAEKVRTWPAAWGFSRLTSSRAVMARASPAVCTTWFEFANLPKQRLEDFSTSVDERSHAWPWMQSEAEG